MAAVEAVPGPVRGERGAPAGPIGRCSANRAAGAGGLGSRSLWPRDLRPRRRLRGTPAPAERQPHRDQRVPDR